MTAKRPANRATKLALRLGRIVVGFSLLGAGAVFCWPHLQDLASGRTGGQKDLHRQLIALKSGESHTVHLYDTPRTDGMLNQLQSMPEIEELTLDFTDVSNQ